MDFEYRVVPAPKRLKRVRGATSEELCAQTLTEAINAEARQGWEYVGSETFAAETVRGLFRRAVTVEETVLVFRRHRSGPRIAAVPHEVLPEPALHAPEPQRERVTEDWAPEPRAQRVVPREPEVARPRGRVPNGESAATGGETGPSLLRPVPRFRPGEPGRG